MKKDAQFEKKVIKPAIKAAHKYQKKHGVLPDESLIRELKIQIINPFLRILSATFGLFLILIGFFLFADQLVFGCISVFTGIVLCIFGFRGRKRRLEGVVDKSDTLGDISLIIEAISQFDW